MVTIKGLSLATIGTIDDVMGYSWRRAELPDSHIVDTVSGSELLGYADVTLSESVTLKAYANDVVLDIGSNVAFISKSDFTEVSIT